MQQYSMKLSHFTKKAFSESGYNVKINYNPNKKQNKKVEIEKGT